MRATLFVALQALGLPAAAPLRLPAPWGRPLAAPARSILMAEPGEAASLPMEPARNVSGTELQCCCADVHGSGIGTGFYRDGFCSTGAQDEGRHTVCIEATESFLAVSAAAGNPLHQPIPEYMFPGVRPGDCWCLCAGRFAQLLELDAQGAVRDSQGQQVKGFIPQIYLQATHEKTLEQVPLETLMMYAADADEARVEMARIDQLRARLEKGVSL